MAMFTGMQNILPSARTCMIKQISHVHVGRKKRKKKKKEMFKLSSTSIYIKVVCLTHFEHAMHTLNKHVKINTI